MDDSKKEKRSNLPEKYPKPKFTTKTLVDSKYYIRNTDSEKKLNDLEEKLKNLEKEKNNGAVSLGLGAIFMGVDAYIIKETIMGIHNYPELFKIIGTIMFLETALFAVCLVGMLYGADKLYKNRKEYNECKNLINAYKKRS